ncbi:MAG: aminotransferase class V-fold PLP-dependent enzyme, partial [Thermodesulfobacteriota bacterium]|nr:aminotransferase class V-fold PLP-dependent enzyme [Thermodesulfobacteriota bacterium]
MAENIVYLDHAATTPLHPEALGIMLPFFGNHFWNPNSAYSAAQKASLAIERARAQVAALIHANPEEIIFTSGGTEADNFA